MTPEAFAKLVKTDWLAAFCEYGSFGEASPRLMFWVGVATIAAALQRRVWLDLGSFQWSPNFYILIVGEQGEVHKSTAINQGMNLLRGIDGICLGPSSATWQALLQYMEAHTQLVTLDDGEMLRMSSVMLPISEFGTLFKPEDQEMADVLTDLWDGRDVFEKITKKSGNDTVVNPCVNLLAAATPAWVASKLTPELLRSGLISRFLFLCGETAIKDVAYPEDAMPPHYQAMRAALVERLQEIAKMSYGGAVKLTKEAKAWGKAWYADQRKAQRAATPGSLDAGFNARMQCHLHKLAMIVAASRDTLPNLDVDVMKEAQRRLEALTGDAKKVLGHVGQTRITSATRRIVEAVRHCGAVERGVLFEQRFMNDLTTKEFAEAISGAMQARLIYESGPDGKSVLMLREGLF